MTVKELIQELLKLDQDKIIKIVSGEGYECEDYARDKIVVNDYRQTVKEIYTHDGSYSHSYSDITNNTKDDDFYILAATDYTKE